MKYVIRYDSPVSEGVPPEWLPYLYHEKCFATGANSKIRGTASPKLSKAECFDTYERAEHIVKMVYSEIVNSADKYSRCLKIVEVTQKEMFKAKLADK